jgi:hypothetical protein
VNSDSHRRSLAVAITLLVIPGAVHGCAKPTAPVPPPSGGTAVQLDFTAYQQTVAPVLAAQGCDATGDCHGGGIRGSLQLSPPGAKDDHFDFDQVSLQVRATDLDHSPILTEPLALAAGGTPHSFKPFASTADSGYQAIHTWIHGGTP